MGRLSTNCHLAFSFAGLLFGLSACGPKLGENPDPEIGPSDRGIFFSLNNPKKYLFQDQDCQKSNQQQHYLQVSGARVWRMEPSGSVQTKLNLSDTHSAPSLQSASVLTSFFGRRFVRDCKSYESSGLRHPQSCLGENPLEAPLYTFTGQQNPVIICNSQGSYSRDSVESAALNAIEAIGQAALLHELSYGVPAEKVTLDLFPEFISRWGQTENPDHGSQAWLTDNLSYFPNNKIIALLPDSAEHTQRYYEYEFAVFHEYGHHKANLLVGKKLQTQHMQWQPSAHSFEIDTVSSSPGIKGRGLDLGIVRAKMISAVAEGYADLFASVAAGSKLEVLKLLPCVGATRDAYSERFADGIALKQLTTEVVDQFFSGSEKVTRCGEPNFSSSHHIGSILAHALLRVFDGIALTHGLSGDMNDRERKTFLIRAMDTWLSIYVEIENGLSRSPQNLAGSHAGFSALGASLEQALEPILRNLVNKGFQHRPSKTKTHICNTSKKYLPALDPIPFHHYCD